MTRKQRRFILIGGALGVLAVAVGLVLYSLSGSIVFFNSPSDIVANRVSPNTRVPLGGLVENGSVKRGDNLNVGFLVTDGRQSVPVSYQGILPDLFREGQGVVVEGTIDAGGGFHADTVLAKHDENYMPKDVADKLKAEGRWKEDYAKKAAAKGSGS